MTRKERIEIPAEIADLVLFESDRTCCVCRKPHRPIQIHHIDDDPSNSSADNLAVLCFDCHHGTQVSGGFDRKLNAAQILLYKSDWLNRVAANRDRQHGPSSTQPADTKGNQILRYLKMKEESEEHLYSFEADYAQVGSEDSTSDAETNLCISAFVTRTLQRFRADAIARAPEKNQMKKTEFTALAWDSLSISHNICLFTHDLISLEFQLGSYYAGAVHPNSQTRTLNLRLHPSMQLELQDIFGSSSNYLELLAEFCVADLHKQRPVHFHDAEQGAKQIESQDEWILSGAGPKHSNYEKFVLVKGGIRVFFDPYQVGSYSEGRYEVFVPLYVVAPALDESIAALLN